MNGIQLEKLQLLYQQIVEDDDMMKELETIINYSASKMKSTISNGAELYEFIEDKLTIFPIGIIPLEINEGYFFLNEGSARNTKVYQYRLSIFEKHDEKYHRSIRTRTEFGCRLAAQYGKHL